MKVDYQDSIDELTDRFTLKDTESQHPIRPQLMGRPTLYIVVADGEGELPRKASGEYHVQTATSSLGMVNLRRQIQRYHYPPEEEGKPVGQMRPRKIDDDLVDDLRAFATHRWPSQPQMTDEERRCSKLPEHLKPRAVRALLGTPAFVEAYWEQQGALRAIQAREEAEERALRKEWSKFFPRAVSHRRRRR